MTQRFRDELGARDEPWLEVTGDRAQRLATAVARIDAPIAATWHTGPPLNDTVTA